MSVLVIVRHGQSAWNLENRFTGDIDVELTPLGRVEAKKAGQLLKNIHFDVGYVSILKRAIHTLDIILPELEYSSFPVYHSKALNERNYGDLQGLNKTETENRFGVEQVNIWRRSYAVAPPNGESLKDTFNRVIPYFSDEIKPQLSSGKNVLIVAHGNSLRALMMHLENLSETQIEEINLLTGVPREYLLDEKMVLKSVSYLE